MPTNNGLFAFGGSYGMAASGRFDLRLFPAADVES